MTGEIGVWLAELVSLTLWNWTIKEAGRVIQVAKSKSENRIQAVLMSRAAPPK